METCKFKRLGVMIDCSRNSVLRVEKIKWLIDVLAYYGYNELQLYTEDTYEVDGEEKFGLFRGRYSREEIREADAYAKSRGIELVPCIQTLAHLNTLKGWEEYEPLYDCNDILLADDEKTYALIDKMFASLAKSFTSRRVNIGMDEAHMLGRGRFYDLHGEESAYKIFVRHLKKVLSIAEKYGFSCRMWSDMFFRLASEGDYYGNGEITRELIELVPKGVALVYWDYDHMDEREYHRMIARHRKFSDKVYFACGAWNWLSYAPLNGAAEKRITAAMNACAEEAVESFTLTFWGDDGAECPYYAAMPLLQKVSAKAYGKEFDEGETERLCGATCADFLTLDEMNFGEGVRFENPSKYLLFDDPFCPKYADCSDALLISKYAKISDKLSETAAKSPFKEMFAYMAVLAKLLSEKCNLANDTYAVYHSGNREALSKLIEHYGCAIAAARSFIEKYREFWLTHFKPFGLEVQEQRFGGLMYRLACCKERLEFFLSGKIEKIEELEEPRVLSREASEKVRKDKIVRQWKQICTVNVL